MNRSSHPRASRRLVIALIAMMATFLVAVPSASAVPVYSHDIGIYATAEISPVDVARDDAGNWYVLDDGLACLRKYAPDRTTILRQGLFDPDQVQQQLCRLRTGDPLAVNRIWLLLAFQMWYSRWL